MRTIITNDELNKFRLVGPDFTGDEPSYKSSFANNLNLTISDIFIYQILSQFSAKSPFLLESEPEERRKILQEDLPLDVNQEFATKNSFQKLMSNFLNYQRRFNIGDYNIDLCYPLESGFKTPDYFDLISSDADYEEIINKGTPFETKKLISCFRKQIPSTNQKDWYTYAWRNLVLHLLKDEITFGIDWKLVNPLIKCNFSDFYNDIKNKWVNLSGYTIDDFKHSVRSYCNETWFLPYSFSGYNYYKLTNNELSTNDISSIPVDYAFPTLKYIDNTSNFFFGEPTNLSNDNGSVNGYTYAIGKYFEDRDFVKSNLNTLSIGLDYDYDEENEVEISVDNICGLKDVVLSGINPRPYAWRGKVNRNFDDLKISEMKLPHRLVNENYQSLKLIAKDFYEWRKMLAANDNRFTVKHMCASPTININYYGITKPDYSNPEKLKMELRCEVGIDDVFWYEVNEDNKNIFTLVEGYLNQLSENKIMIDRQPYSNFEPLPLYYTFEDVVDYFGDKNQYVTFFSETSPYKDQKHKWVVAKDVEHNVAISKSPDCNSLDAPVSDFYNNVYFPVIKSWYPKSEQQQKQDKLTVLYEEYQRLLSEATTEEEKNAIEVWYQEEQRKIENAHYDIDIPQFDSNMISVYYWWDDKDKYRTFYRYNNLTINCCTPELNEICSTVSSHGNVIGDINYADNLGKPLPLSAIVLRTAPTTSYPIKELANEMTADYLAFNKFEYSKFWNDDKTNSLCSENYVEISEYNNQISVAFEDSWYQNLKGMLDKMRNDSEYFKSTPRDYVLPEKEKQEILKFRLDDEKFELDMVPGMNHQYVPYFRDTGRTAHLYIYDSDNNLVEDYDYEILEVTMAPIGTPIEKVIFPGTFYNYDFALEEGYISFGPTSRTFELKPSDKLFTDPNQLSDLLNTETCTATTATKQFVEVDLTNLLLRYE